jgi:rhodanese-related sulfurtransferase
VNVGLDGRFAEYAGDVVRPGQSVVLVGDHGRSDEARVRLSRIGFDDVVGALEDVEAVLAARPELARQARRLPAVEVAAWLAEDPALQVVDVRNPGEFALGAVPGARNLPLPRLLERVDELDPDAPTIVYCAGGYRSSAAASALRSLGFRTVADMIGGYEAWPAPVGG